MKSRITILGVVTDAFGSAGGIASVTRDLVRVLGRSELIEKVVLLPRYAPEPIERLPPSTQQRSPVQGRLNYAVSALIAAFRMKPDIVYCNHLHIAPLAQVIANLFSAKLVVHVHGIEVWSKLSRRRRLALEASDCVLCVSRHTRAAVMKQCDIASERVIVLNNTFDKVFLPGKKKEARDKFGLKAEKILLTVGRLASSERYKGHDRVIGLMPDLLKEHDDLLYLIGSKGDDLERLQSLAKNNGVEKSVRFLGFVSNEDLPDLYRAADVFTMPSTGEGFGVAFVEAMACGTPAIGLAVGGANDALAHADFHCRATEESLGANLSQLLRNSAYDSTQISGQAIEFFGEDTYERRLTGIMQRLRPK